MSDYKWKCSHCGEAVTEKGFMVLRDEEIQKIYESEKVSAMSELSNEITWEDLVNMSDGRGSWTVQCVSCSKTIPDDGYCFEINRISTTAQALDWTLHLSDKGYVGMNSNWSDLLRSSVVESVEA